MKKPTSDFIGAEAALLLLLALAVPYLSIGVAFPLVGLSDQSLLNSLAGSAVAIVAAILLNGQITKFPGPQSFARRLTPFLASFTFVIIAMLLLRLDYSRLMLALSASMALFVILFLNLGRRATRVPHYWAIAGGAIDSFVDRPFAKIELLPAPALPSDHYDGFVADFDSDIPDEWESFMARAALRGIPVYHYKQVEEALTGRVDIAHISENAWGALSPDWGYMRFKRVGDVLGSLLIMPLLLPIFALIALAIRIDSNGPVFFFQDRIGRGGVPFRMIKFRSMRPARAIVDARDDAITLDNDGRVTRIGRFIRRYRIDELPQVINILAGQMSWIGPRPEAQALSEWYEKELPFYVYRHIVAPGISGWAQVNQGHVADLTSVHDKLRYDFYYIKHFSLWLDLLIVVRTFSTVLKGFGAR